MAIVGIDLGTYNSAVAYVNKHGGVDVIPNAEGDLMTPSVVFFDGDQIIVGKIAKQNAVLESENVVAFIKRQMGRQDYFFEHAGKKYSPMDISSFILRKLKADAEAALGEPVDEAIVTVPAHFDQGQRRMTEEAAVLAGLKVKQIINEPTAAALAYGLQNLGKNQKILVYDLGGGTFDVTIMEIKDGQITVLNNEGDPELGGKDWDARIIEYVAGQFKAEHSENPLEDLQTHQTLQDAAERNKEVLSQRASVKMNCAYNAKTVTVEITREKFEELTQDLLDRADGFVIQAMTGAGLSWPLPILMVGGSCKMPMVETRLRVISGADPLKAKSLDLMVVTGAALATKASSVVETTTDADGKEVKKEVGAEIHTEEGTIMFFDVLNKSIGVETLDPTTGKLAITKMLEKNSRLGESKTEMFATPRPNQLAIDIKVYEGENADPQLCTFLGKAQLSGLPPGRPERQPVEITLTSTKSGTIKVSGKDKNSGKDVEAEISLVGASSATELQERKAEIDEAHTFV